MAHGSKSRKKKYIPRPVIVPQMIQGFDIVDSVRAAINGIRAQFDGSCDVIERQHLADLNMVWQQCAKVHEKMQRREPSRREVLAAQNVLSRLNADGEIKRSEFEYLVDILQRVLAAVRKDTPVAVWRDVELTMQTKEVIHGHNGEHWFGGVLLKETGVSA